jgi:hypothetical protein
MPSYTPQSQSSSDDALRPAPAVCNSCGAWVSGQDEDKHNKFHEALRQLFDNVQHLAGELKIKKNLEQD